MNKICKHKNNYQNCKECHMSTPTKPWEERFNAKWLNERGVLTTIAAQGVRCDDANEIKSFIKEVEVLAYKRGREEILDKVFSYLPDDSADFRYISAEVKEFASQLRSLLSVPLTPEKVNIYGEPGMNGQGGRDGVSVSEKGEEKLGGAGRAENVFYHGDKHCEEFAEEDGYCSNCKADLPGRD